MSGCVLPRGRAYQGAVVLNPQKVPPAAIPLSSSSRGMYGSCLSFAKITSAWISETRQNLHSSAGPPFACSSMTVASNSITTDAEVARRNFTPRGLRAEVGAPSIFEGLLSWDTRILGACPQRDYLSNCVVLAVIQSTASFFVAKPSIRRSWPSWYLMTTCHPVPTLSGKGSIMGFSSKSSMQAICTWAVSASSPAFGLRGPYFRARLSCRLRGHRVTARREDLRDASRLHNAIPNAARSPAPPAPTITTS